MRTRLVALAACATLAGAAAASAVAARPLHVTEAQAVFPERAYIVGLPAQMKLGARQVQVFENGVPVTGVSVVAAGAATAKEFGVVLAIDASDSMRGAPIEQAIKAARIFADRRNPQERIAIITFNSSVQVVQGFTRDPEKIRAALATTPPLVHGTHIYDAVDAAATLLREAHIQAGSVVLLSDGADYGSELNEAGAADVARGERMRVFTVGLRSRFFDSRSLRSLALDTGAQYSEANSPVQLQRVYAALSAKLAGEYIVRYRSAAGPGRRIVVSVRVRGLPGVVTAGYATPRIDAGKPGARPYHESFVHRLFTSPLTMIFIALLTAALVALAVIALASSWRKGTLRKRMAEFVSFPADEKERASGAVTDRVEGGTERILGKTRWWNRFVAEIELAGISTAPERIVLFTFIGTFLTIWLLSVIIPSGLVAVLVGLTVPLGVRTFIKRKVARKRKLFAEQLPDNLQVLASALRAGHSFIGALSVVVEDAPEPSRSEFRRVIADEQLGVTLDQALHVVVERMENRELEQVSLVAALQRQSGGNTAEVLDRVTETIRERFELRRTVQTLTAQGRMSRWIVSLLPVLLLVVITVINPSYMRVLYANTGGRIALALAGMLVVSGSLVIKRIINIRI
jgi:tight adherence protein B